MTTNTAATGIGEADPLLSQARAWVEQLRARDEEILRQPVSRLQLEFRIGYAHACALVEVLALDKYWCIELGEDGRRYARLRPGAEA